MREIRGQGPAAAILGILAEFLETEAAVGAPEDVDAALALGIFEAEKDGGLNLH